MALLDPVLNPLLAFPPLVIIFILALAISLIIIIVYKFMTDQKLMKAMKKEIKHLQKEMKKFRDNPGKMMEINQKVMKKNMEYMKHSMKPTLFTMLPIILIFGWMNANLAFDSINPGQEFDVTIYLEEHADEEVSIEVPPEIIVISDNPPELKETTSGLIFRKTRQKGTWTLKGEAGGYMLNFLYDGEYYNREVTITQGDEYSPQTVKIDEGDVVSIDIEYQKKRVLNLFGWKLSWFWAYVIFSLVFSMTLRKLLKVH